MIILTFLPVALTLVFLPLSLGSSSLDAVVVVFRHGDRTPIRPYPNDPYSNRSYWSVDWGMLTNLGKERHYNLGKYFRNRYSTFLPDIYSEKDIYVRSTDVDRTLMSAASDLAGLYPPVGKDVWDKDLSWQPIPIHSIPEKLDAVLAAKKPCKKHKYLLKRLFQTEYFRNISHLNHDLYAFLSRYSGDSISSLEKISYLYNTLKIEADNNFTLPEWTKKVFPEKMEPWSALSFATDTFTTDLQRLKTGPFFNNLLQYFHNRTTTPSGSQYYSPKFLMFSAHDTTIANLLNTLQAFQYHCPPYTATLIFELHKTPENSFYVNVFYKNGTEARPINVGKCDFNCDLKSFQQFLSPISLSLDEWESECNSVLLYGLSLNLILSLGGLVLGICSIAVLTLIVRKRVRNSDRSLYSQLPNEEYA